MSGYGLNQEAPVARSYTQRYRPDVVLVEVYPDDVRDVLTDTATLRKQLGIDEPDDVRSVFGLERLRTLISDALFRPLLPSFHRPSSYDGYSLGQFVFLERGHAEWDGAAVRESAERYREIARAARAVGARTILVFVPAPAQVCNAGSLAYYPPNVALDDRSRFDDDLPDRRARAIAAAAHVPLLDVSSDLRAKFSCAYVPDNPYLRPAAESELASLVARMAPIRRRRARAPCRICPRAKRAAGTGIKRG